MKYLVTIDYNHKKGFEMSEDMVVVAPDQEGAISYLSGLLSSRASVKSIARTRAISIEPIESPAPTDWGKELSKIQDLREKAKQYIISVVPADGLFIGGFYVYEAGNGDVEIRHIEIRKSDNHITLNNEDISPIYSGDISDSDWVQLALIVQETINGGTGK